MRYAVVLGAGGHCRVVLSILFDCRHHEVLSIVELSSPRPGEVIMGTPVMDSPDYLSTLFGRIDVDVFLAIGNNAVRSYWWKRVNKMGFPMPNLVSPHALVAESTIMGNSNIICPRAFVGPLATLGDNNLINTAAVVEHEVSIGNDCHIAPSSTIAGRSILKDSCFVGSGATVIDGISVACRTVIGAGATLITTVEQPGGVYVGVPAKRRGSVE